MLGGADVLDSGGVALGLLQLEKPQTFVYGRRERSFKRSYIQDIPAVEGAFRVSSNPSSLAGKKLWLRENSRFAADSRNRHPGRTEQSLQALWNRHPTRPRQPEPAQSQPQAQHAGRGLFSCHHLPKDR